MMKTTTMILLEMVNIPRQALPTVSPFSSISATYPTIGGFTNYLLASTLNSKRGPHSFDPPPTFGSKSCIIAPKARQMLLKWESFADEVFRFKYVDQSIRYKYICTGHGHSSG